MSGHASGHVIRIIDYETGMESLLADSWRKFSVFRVINISSSRSLGCCRQYNDNNISVSCLMNDNCQVIACLALPLD